MKPLKQGILIACEGIDGSGKSTLSHFLFNHYKTTYNTLLTKEPGGSPLGFFLRSHLQKQTIPTCPKAEFLLFAADRAQHFHEIIIPALEKKQLIFSDRLSDSSLVYQGFGRGLSCDTLQTINSWVMENHKPMLTIYVRVSLETALKRIHTRNITPTAFEQNKVFFEKLVTGFETLYAQRDDVILIDGDQTQQDVITETQTKIDTFLTNYY